jgi:hypothetical protein
MNAEPDHFASEFYGRFKIFHELMSVKIRNILLVASPYDAYILEEDGSLASRIINEYSGLNLSLPPRVTRASSPDEALNLLKARRFDLLITTPHLEGTNPCVLGLAAKKMYPDLPVILLAHNPRHVEQYSGCRLRQEGIDRIFVWTGNSDLLLAIVKNMEDMLNVENDTQKARVRVLILIEDSPMYRSYFLPLIYKEVVKQTQNVLVNGLNEEHRLLRMRARPKILLAGNYEQAMMLYVKYRDYLFGIISDGRFPQKGVLEDNAGNNLLSAVRKDIPDLPLLMLSSNPDNEQKALNIPAVFLDKNSPALQEKLTDFFLNHLGFGDFVFRMPDGTEVARAHNLRTLAQKVAQVPDECLWYHADHNHFSNWIMSRSEIALASKFRSVRARDFKNIGEVRDYIIININQLRKWRQKGVVTQFVAENYDVSVMDFVKMGNGSLGGKARGLAFMSTLLHDSPRLHEKYRDIEIAIPKSLVITTQGFEEFVKQNQLSNLVEDDFSDEEVTAEFLSGRVPGWLAENLKMFLHQADFPLSIRSSSRLEDAHFQPYAGLYETYMIPNNHPDLSVRLEHLLTAIKRVYASTYYQGPKSFSKNTGNRHREEAMAVIIQQTVGLENGNYFYPAISGVAQSHNFYPIPPMKPEDGIAHIALGLGKTVVEGGKALRFSLKYPEILPQFSTVDDILANAQRFFYALKIKGYPPGLNFNQESNLEKLEVSEAEAFMPVKMLSGTYIPEEHRIRDSGFLKGPKVLTFAQVLKYNAFPLCEILSDLLDTGRKALGCPVEIEFSVNLYPSPASGNKFFFLQMRPMAAYQDQTGVFITDEDAAHAFCACFNSLGNGQTDDIADILFVMPEKFKAESTPQIAREIGKINAALIKEDRPYVLAGPGRWGSADRWLGIPVEWRDISGAKAIVELRNETLRADPSQGSHFFQNMTSQGIYYLTLDEGGEDFFDWDWVQTLPIVQETDFLRHVRLNKPMTLKADGRSGRCVMLAGE